MRRFLFLIPLLFVVFAAPRIAEAQSFCSLSGVEWTRCFDFSSSTHGFSLGEAGEYVAAAGWRSTEIAFDPFDPSFRHEYVQVLSPSGWSGAAITQVRIVYDWTPGANEDIGDPWASLVSGSAVSWSRAELEAGAGTITKSASITASDVLSVSMYGAQCMSCSTPGSVSGSITMVGLVIGGTGTPPPGEEPSTGGGGGAPAELNLDMTPLIESIGTYIPLFLVIFAIPGGIVLAIAIVRTVVNAITSVINNALNNG